MRRLTGVLVLLAVWWLASAGAALAQSGTRVALVIGNSDYRNLPALSGSVLDARAIADELRWLDFEVIVGTDLARGKSLKLLAQFTDMLDEAEIGLIYFAGYGAQVDGANYLLPVDAAPDAVGDADREWLALADALQALDGSGAAGVVLVDAVAAPLPDRPGHESAGGLAPVSPGSELIVVFSDQPGTVAADGEGPNPFAEALLRNLSWPVDAVTMLQAVREEVMAATGGRQQPWIAEPGSSFAILGALIGGSSANGFEAESFDAAPFPSLAPPVIEPEVMAEAEPPPPPEAVEMEPGRPVDSADPDTGEGADDGGAAGAEPPPVAPQPAPAAPEVTELTLWDAIADSNNAAAYQAYLALYPNGRFAELARLRLQALAAAPEIADAAPPPAPDAAVAAPPPAPAEPATVAATRYPAMDLPERVLPGEAFPLMIWLSRVAVTPEVEVAPGPGATVDGGGALTMPLPQQSDWTFRIVLNAPGFRLGEGAGPIAEIAMDAEGDSTPALFLLTAEPGAHPDGRATIRATLWHGATFLASLQRTVLVGTEAVAPGAVEAALVSHAGGIAIDPGYRTADLTMRVDYADPAALGPGQVIIASPHFQTPLIVGEIDTPAATADWLAFQYESFIRARNQDRARGGQHTGEPLPPGESLTRPLMRGFGQELYRRFAPQVFKDALWALVDDPGTPIETIQIYSNNPLLPWELMRPVGAGGEELDFLGVAFQIARWHGAEGPSMFDRPRQALAFDELVAIAPQYAGSEALASVEAELASLRALPGFREVPGRFGAVQSLFAAPPHGIVHFAGHGVVSDAPAPAGPRSYMIRLEDLDLNVTAWRGLSAGAAEEEDVFYFFNACDIGQAAYVANFVDGWAPAVLEAGAAGFIGGLWPVFDDSAAAFAGRFYAEIDRRVQDGPASVAAVLRELRGTFAETGDPTWLSYVYYGDVNLRLTRGVP